MRESIDCEDNLSVTVRSGATMGQKLDQVNYYITRILRKVERDADRLIFIPIIVYALFFSAYTCYLHYIFKTYAWDLGLINQSLWTTLNSGKMLYSTLEVPYGNPSGIFLGVHFSPILFVILPIYAVFESPQTLLVFQSFILAIAALPLYWIARDKLNNKLYALGFAVVYLLNPALHGVNTFDFHVEIFTPVLVLFAFYFLEKGRWLKALPFILLELLTIEFAPIIVFFLGLPFFLRKLRISDFRKNVTRVFKGLLLPAAIMIVGVVSFYLAMNTIASINSLKVGGPYRTWGYWGSNISEAISNMIRRPADVLIMIFTPIDKPYYLTLLFSSAMFLPLLAPLELLMSVPWLLAAFLTDYPPYYQPYFQYSALVLGQLFVAAIFGFRRLFGSDNKKGLDMDLRKKIMTLLLVVNVGLFFAISPVGISAFTNRTIRPYAISTEADLVHVGKIYEALALIPDSASVATIQDIFPHLCQRLHAYFLKWPLDYNVDYIVVDSKSPTISWGIEGPKPDQIVIDLLSQKTYGILASIDGVLVLKRGYSGPVEYYSPQVDVFDYRQLVAGVGAIRWDYTSSSGKVIVTDPNASVGTVWFGPYKYFTPGNYSSSFKIKTTNETTHLMLDVTTNLGIDIVAKRTVNGSDFKRIDSWQEFTLYFRIEELTLLEFRGTCLSNNTQVAVDFVEVTQVNP